MIWQRLNVLPLSVKRAIHVLRRLRLHHTRQGRTQDFRRGGAEGGGGVPRSAKEANNPILLKVQSLQLSFRPAGVSLGGSLGGGGPRPPLAPPCVRPCQIRYLYSTHSRHMSVWSILGGD